MQRRVATPEDFWPKFSVFYAASLEDLFSFGRLSVVPVERTFFREFRFGHRVLQKREEERLSAKLVVCNLAITEDVFVTSTSRSAGRFVCGASSWLALGRRALLGREDNKSRSTDSRFAQATSTTFT